MLGKEFHLLADGIALQAQAVGAEGIHRLIVKSNAVKAATHQRCQDLIELGVVTTVGKAAGVGQQSHIQATGSVPVQETQQPHLHQDTEHQFAGR